MATFCVPSLHTNQTVINLHSLGAGNKASCKHEQTDM